MSPLLNSGINGAGQTIAIMGQSYVNVSDIENFQNAAGLPSKAPTLVLVPGTGADQTTSAVDEGESDLDLEWSGAMAPGAKVVFVYTGSSPNFGVFDSAEYAIDNALGTIISLSYTSCETDPGLVSSIKALEAMFQQAAAQGQSVFAASGDQGSSACYGDTTLTTTEQETEAVNYPASSAYVTGVGGTEISQADSVSTNTTYWEAETQGTDITNSAKTYIPEIAWNDDAANCGQNSCFSATGGGTSALIAQPSWQTSYFTATGEANPASQWRLVPDVAFYSSPGFPGYLYCTSDTSSWSQGQTASCSSGFRDGNTGALTVAGGTSFATPIFAGMNALLNQKANYVTGAGLVNPTLYKLASNAATYLAAFHDVTSGNNDCLAGAGQCANTAGYSAGTGYDEVTGLGSVDLGALATVWPENSGASATLLGTTTTVTPANSAPSVNTNDVFTISVASDTGATIPTGTITLEIDGGANCFGEGASQGCGGTTLTNLALSANGTVTYTANFATAGTHQVVAIYSGDATHAASTGVGEVAIAVTSSGKGSITAAATPATLTVSQGSSGIETITITPAGGYTGTVTVNLDFGSSDSALQNLCAGFSASNSAGLGLVQITGAQAEGVNLDLDTNASDCATAAIAKAKGMHSFRQVHAGNLAASNQGVQGNNPPPNPLSAAIALGGLLLAGLVGRHSRRLRNLVCIAVLVAAGLVMSACGSSSSTTTVSNPPKGTYTATITATDSTTNSITATTTFTFVID
jgi:hypothetical protein